MQNIRPLDEKIVKVEKTKKFDLGIGCLKGVSSPKILYCENFIQASYNKTSEFFVLEKNLFL
jgi:hypothetical protein